MADLSADEAQRLARLFLTGRAEAGDLARLSAALPQDPTLALELLAQMQAALDDVAPSALTAEQDRSVDARIEALIAPRIRRRGPFSWLRRLFRRAPKEAAPSRRAKAAPAPPPAASLPEPPLPSPGGGDDALEETVPIVPAEAAAPVPAAPPSRPETQEPQAVAPARRGLPWASLGLLLLGLLLAGGAYWGWRAWAERAPAPAPSPPPPAPEPAATPASAQPGLPVRARAGAAPSDEPLPALLPPLTPQAAGLLTPEP